MRILEGPILALAAAFLASSSGAQAQPPVTPIPTLENLQTGLMEMISRLHLTHTQHEQVERIITNEAVELSLTRENPNLPVAGIFAQEHSIRLQTRRQIEAILTPRQIEKVMKLMIHDMEERQRWGHDPTAFFSIPSTY